MHRASFGLVCVLALAPVLFLPVALVALVANDEVEGLHDDAYSTLGVVALPGTRIVRHG